MRWKIRGESAAPASKWGWTEESDQGDCCSNYRSEPPAPAKGRTQAKTKTTNPKRSIMALRDEEFRGYQTIDDGGTEITIRSLCLTEGYAIMRATLVQENPLYKGFRVTQEASVAHA